MLYQIKSKILLVDDEQTFREAYKDLFEEYGWWVFTADSLESANKLLDNHYFHAATLDIRLVDDEEHNEQGMQLLQRIYKSDEPTGVVIITGFPTNERYRAAFLTAIEQNRQVDFLEKKSLDDEKLVESLTKAYLFAQKELEKKRNNLTIQDFALKINLIEFGQEIAKDSFRLAEDILLSFAHILFPFKVLKDSESISQNGEGAVFSITLWSKMFGSAHTIKIGYRKTILEEKFRLEEENIHVQLKTTGSISGILYANA